MRRWWTGLAALLGMLLAGVQAQAAPPNIVLILADDLGWVDVGCNGGDVVETPNIDRLAQAGVRFTQAYAMPVCSPSRGALLTGKHAARLHITIWAEGSLKGPANRKLLQAESLHNLPHTETTLAAHLQKAGYLTALIGKWHLGDADHFPETHGFDVDIGGTHWGAPETFWWPYRGTGRFGPEYRFVPHLEFGQPGEYLTDRLTDEALKVIDNAGKQPFFLYLAHHAPHTPMEAKTNLVEHFRQKIQPGMHHQNPVYAAMVKSLDESVGRVWDHLRVRGLEENTLFIFTSDNGGYIGVDRKAGQTMPVTDNFPLRSGKGSCYEGGIRVPMIVKWPGVTKPGQVCTEPVVLMDLFNTLLAAGAPTTQLDAAKQDGLNLLPLLKDPTAHLGRDSLYWHYPHYYETTTPVSAVRNGDWKLLEYFEDNHVELYNLKDDPSEKTDLAQQMPEKADALRTQLHAWRESVGANLPTTNPDFNGDTKKGGKAKK